MKQEIVDHGDPRKYYAAIPNLVMKLGLNPYELALYVHMKKAAGDDGVCFKSRATLAKESGMSAGMVTKARQTLAMPRKELGNKPLIHVKEETNKEGGKPRCIITITDIWPINMQQFTTSPHDVEVNHKVTTCQSTSPHDAQGHHTTSQGHTAATKNNPEEEPVKKNPEETVFEFWKLHLDHPKSVFDDKRRKAVRARLREGHSVDDLILAVRGCKLTPHNMGQNERQTVYDDIELICRDTTHVERFIATAQGTNGNGNGYKPTASTRRVDQIKSNLEFIRSGGRAVNS